jgi:hypothetical protein
MIAKAGMNTIVTATSANYIDFNIVF